MQAETFTQVLYIVYAIGCIFYIVISIPYTKRNLKKMLNYFYYQKSLQIKGVHCIYFQNCDGLLPLLISLFAHMLSNVFFLILLHLLLASFLYFIQ